MKLPSVKNQGRVLIILLAVLIAVMCCSCTKQPNNKSFSECQVYRHSYKVKHNKKAMFYQGNIKVKKAKYNKHLSGNFCQVKKARKRSF